MVAESIWSQKEKKDPAEHRVIKENWKLKTKTFNGRHPDVLMQL